MNTRSSDTLKVSLTIGKIRAMASQGCSPSEILVWLILLAHADSEWRCFPSVSLVGAYTGLAQRHVIRVLGHLEEMGIVRREMRSGCSTIYYITHPPTPDILSGVPRAKKAPPTPDILSGVPLTSCHGVKSPTPDKMSPELKDLRSYLKRDTDLVKICSKDSLSFSPSAGPLKPPPATRPMNGEAEAILETRKTYAAAWGHPVEERLPGDILLRRVLEAIRADGLEGVNRGLLGHHRIASRDGSQHGRGYHHAFPPLRMDDGIDYRHLDFDRWSEFKAAGPKPEPVLPTQAQIEPVSEEVTKMGLEMMRKEIFHRGTNGDNRKGDLK